MLFFSFVLQLVCCTLSIDHSAKANMDKFSHFVVHCKKRPYDVYCGRNSGGALKDCSDFSWGNPFPMQNNSIAERNRCCHAFRDYLFKGDNAVLLQRVKTELKGKRLACWCSPKLCHCHILATVANSSNGTCDKADLDRFIQHLLLANKKSSRKQTAQPRHRQTKKATETTNTTSQPAIVPSATTTNVGTVAVQLPRPQQPHQSASYIDIGINITSKQLRKQWRGLIERAEQRNVNQILLTGTSIRCVQESLKIANTWRKETKRTTLFCTVGVHPHDASSFTPQTKAEMRQLLQDELAVAVGECGLDYNRNFSSPKQQKVCVQKR